MVRWSSSTFDSPIRETTRFFRFVVMSSAVFAFLGINQANAFYRSRVHPTGQKIFWRTEDLPIRWANNTSALPVGMENDVFEKGLQLSYNQWSGHAKSQLSYTLETTTDPLFTKLWIEGLGKIDPNLGLNSLHVVNQEWVKAGLPAWADLGFGSRTIAVTITYLRGPNGGHLKIGEPISGAVVDADIVINNQNFTFCVAASGVCAATDMDLTTVVAHEVGHQMGLDHHPTNTSSLMYPSISMGQIKSVSPDEIAAAECIYPVADGSPDMKAACALEEGGGGPPGGKTYLYGSNDDDNSGACAGVAPLSSHFPPKNGGTGALLSWALSLLLLVGARRLHGRLIPIRSSPAVLS